MHQLQEPAPTAAVAPLVPGWRLRLLGGLRLTGPDGAERTPAGRKSRGLLAVLALAAGTPVARERLAELLWGERGAEQARGSLRQSLKELRRCLDEPGLLRIDRDRAALATGRIAVDALELAAAGADPPPDRLLELCAGELLEGLGGLGPGFEEWLAGQRERFRTLALDALERRVEAAAGAAELQALTARMLALEPAHEPAHRALMLLHARRGDTAAALRQFEACREALARRLDARPSAQTAALVARIRSGAVPAAAEPVVAAAGPARPSGATSLVVLPLREQSGPGGLPPLGEGLAEEISAALARFRWIFVLAPSSAAVLGRELGDPLAIARRVEARYLVDGRLVHEPGGLRLCVELVDAATARLLWTEQETVTPAALATLPGELAQALAARLARELLLREVQRTTADPPGRADAHVLVLRAARLTYSLELPDLEAAAGLLGRALTLDPDHPGGHAWRAFALMARAGYPWRPGHAELIEQTERHAARALQLDPAEAMALATRAQCRVLARDFDQALRLAERAITANPALPMAWGRRGLVACYLGEPEVALACLDRYRRLSPFDPFQSLFGRVEVFAHLLAGRYEQAVAAARPLIARKPLLFGCYMPMLAALGHLGRSEEAAACRADVYRIEPRFSLAAFRAGCPLRQERDLEHYVEGLRRAGLREHAPEPTPTGAAARPAG